MAEKPLVPKHTQEIGKYVLSWGNGPDGAAARLQQVSTEKGGEEFLKELKASEVSVHMLEEIRDWFKQLKEYYRDEFDDSAYNKAVEPRLQLALRAIELLKGDKRSSALNPE